jgi:hypothetical protein
MRSKSATRLQTINTPQDIPVLLLKASDQPPESPYFVLLLQAPKSLLSVLQGHHCLWCGRSDIFECMCVSFVRAHMHLHTSSCRSSICSSVLFLAAIITASDAPESSDITRSCWDRVVSRPNSVRRHSSTAAGGMRTTDGAKVKRVTAWVYSADLLGVRFILQHVIREVMGNVEGAVRHGLTLAYSAHYKGVGAKRGAVVSTNTKNRKYKE